MRSPEARTLLNNILDIARRMQLAGGFCPDLHTCLLEMGTALEAYDEFCSERHYSLSMDLASNSTAHYVSDSKTKAEHFQLPTGT